MEHTPGEWIADGTTVYADHGIQVHIAYYHDSNGRPLTDKAEDNAKIGAAAPELLEACEEALKEFEYMGVSRKAIAIILLRKAIAKAKGETT